MYIYITYIWGCRRLEIPEVSQIANGEHMRSHVHDPTRGSMMNHDVVPLLGVLRTCFCNPVEL